jgi:cell division GTPase FtsZ
MGEVKIVTCEGSLAPVITALRIAVMVFVTRGVAGGVGEGGCEVV